MGVEDLWRESVNRSYEAGHDYHAMRDSNLDRIQGVIGGSKYWIKKHRAELIKVLVSMKVGAKSTIYRYLRRYWQRGQTPNALLPDYANCGGKGKPKTRGEKRLGRPKEHGSYDSSQSTPEMESVMETAIKYTIFSGKYTVLVFDDKYLKVEVKNLSVDKCVKTSLEHVLIDLEYMIKQLQNEEKKVRKDIREYGVAFEESSAVTLSSTIMLRDVISSIKLN